MSDHEAGDLFERRKVVLTKEDVVDAIQAAFKDHEQGDHHRFVTALLEEQRRRSQMWEQIKVRVGGWAFVGLVIYFLSLIAKDFKQSLAAFFSAFLR